MQCPRCNGFIVLQSYDVDDDPRCSSCSRLFPHLKPKAHSNGSNSRHGLRDTIRYTGSIESLKGTTCTISYKAHPSPSVSYPLLEVSCPWCTGVAEIRSGIANPAAGGYKSSGRYTARKWANVETKRYAERETNTGGAYVKCPTGHMFRLKLTSEGEYSWE